MANSKSPLKTNLPLPSVTLLLHIPPLAFGQFCNSPSTGASKWNPIEHRLFSEICKNWAGEPLDSHQKILNFIRSTRTQAGLSVTGHLDRRYYPTGTEPTPE